jgi:FKBP-type peptidyl-prolyl cis-trans isomerase SlyD
MFAVPRLLKSSKLKTSIFNFKKFYANRVVSFHYKLKDQKTGDLYDQNDENSDAFSYVEGQQQILPNLEKRMESLNAGDKAVIELDAKDAYGVYNKELMTSVPRKNFSFEIKEGDHVNVGHDPLSYRIHSISEQTVTLDLNHPLAGVDLVFDIHVTETREATEEERKPQHVHGPGCGHDHSHDHHTHEHVHGEGCGHDHSHDHDHTHEHVHGEGCGHDHSHDHQHTHEHVHDKGCSHDHKHGEGCSPTHKHE